MGLQKKAPFSGQSIVENFDTFFVIKRLSENNENFTNVSPFLVEKAITGSVGIVTSTKLMRSGDLLFEVASRKQAQQILSINFLSNIPVSVQQHETLNTSKDVITYGRLLNLPIEEITQELSGQGVKDVQRINIRRDGELVPIKHFILTYNTPRLLKYIKAGCVRCSVRSYIPNPLRCFKCQRFGHSKTNCRGTLACARCAVAGHESTGFTAVEKCVNCQGKAHHKDINNATSAKVTSSPSDSSQGNSSDTDSDMGVNSAPEISKHQRNRARSQSEKSQKLKQTKRGLSQKDLPTKFKKSAHYNSVTLGLADLGIVHKDLPSIFGGVPQVPDLKLHPSDEDEDSQMNCDASETRPCVPTSNRVLSFSWNCRGIRSRATGP
ncbi:hypothetical protein AVEN_100049-1 [Araneus ventricosus]|uniref:CCHC-type domain-containing protein n=1 Tax=Araneus ventricosus TaxID=182803 RepID=A0A4Y2QPU5_ARAVE|nr:hypothetical protein AVEN_100049-1 [Araneus ventricosus]